MMRNPDFQPRKVEEKHETVMVGSIETWVVGHSDEPFLDPIERDDPRVHQWREILRAKYNFNKDKT